MYCFVCDVSENRLWPAISWYFILIICRKKYVCAQNLNVGNVKCRVYFWNSVSLF
jgi:hypothetical protein